MWFILLVASLALADPPSPEDRALAYLAREVPRWSVENKCYSCHNNGDGVRALYAGLRQGHTVTPAVLRDTTTWLSRPQHWGEKEEDQPFKDRRLARLQFAVALNTAVLAGQLLDRAPLKQAAELVATEQHANGSWQVEAPGTLGSPGTRGIALATVQARDLLREVDRGRYAQAIRQADEWLDQFPLVSVLDAAAVMMGEAGRPGPAAARQREQALAIIRKGEARDGGWGPYTNAPPEPFDTAVVLLALARNKEVSDSSGMLQRGRAFLLRTQLAGGGWPATTRPAGADSYAQHIATSSWACLALLLSRQEPPRR